MQGKKKRFVGVLDCYQGAFVVHIPSVYVGKRRLKITLGSGRVVQRGRVGAHHELTVKLFISSLILLLFSLL